MDHTRGRAFDEGAGGFFAAVIGSSDEAIISNDFSGTILSWNRGAERLYGYSAAEAIGCSIEMIIPAGHSNELPDILGRIKAGERIDRYEAVRLAKDGRLVDVLLTVSPIHDPAGAIVGVATIARDISADKENILKARNSEALLRSLMDSAVDGIIVIDARGRIESFNRAAERLFGYTFAEVTGRNVNMLMPSPYHEDHDRCVSGYLTTGVRKIIGTGRDVVGRRKDGTTFPLYLSVGEIDLDGDRKFTGILHDLTARLQIEEQLREQAALARLGEMAAVIAHEVKNPLAAVRGAIQVIGKRLAAGSREAAVVGEIVGRIDGLNALVKDLLLFARPPQPRPAPVSISALLAATVSLLGEDAAHREVRVEVEGEAPPVMADAELLKIVFVNLFINSAHAMRGKGVISVSVSSSNGMCHVAVADTGPGISPEIRDRLFTPFVTTKARGTGLGLSTVKRLVEAHHGRIHVESPPGGGTTMTVRLPLVTS